jgi:hypothetical protein
MMDTVLTAASGEATGLQWAAPAAGGGLSKVTQDCRFAIQKEQQKLELEQLRQTKIEAYKKLGLSAEEIEAILPTPKPEVSL